MSNHWTEVLNELFTILRPSPQDFCLEANIYKNWIRIMLESLLVYESLWVMGLEKILKIILHPLSFSPKQVPQGRRNDGPFF